MPGFTKRRFFRILLTVFRWCRISVWLVILLLLAGFLYLHLADLPDFLKKPMLRDLHARGIDAEFSGMRLGWSQEILVQNVSFGRAGEKDGPNLSVGSAEIRIDFKALLHREFKVRSLTINDGRFFVPVVDDPSKSISLDNVHFVFRFLPGDCVQLENARGNIRDVAIHLEGVVTNFSAIRNWRPSTDAPKQPASTNQHWQTTLRQVVSIAEQIQFSAPPELSGQISGDANSPDSMQATLRITAPGAVTPWGKMNQFKLNASCSHIINPGNSPFAQLNMSANGITTDWGSGNEVKLAMELHRASEDMNLMAATVSLGASHVRAFGAQLGTNFVNVSNLQWNGAMTFGMTNFAIPTAEGQLRIQQLDSSWGSFQEAAVVFHSATNRPAEPIEMQNVFWQLAQERKLDWKIEAKDIKTPQIVLQSAQCAGHWNSPSLVIDNVESTLYDGVFKSSAHLNLSSRELGATLFANFDPKSLSPFLSPTALKWLNDFKYSKPPTIQCEASVTLPAWTNQNPNWLEEVLPTLQATGQFAVGPLTTRWVNVQSAESAFTFSNLTWTISKLHAVHEDGEVRLDYSGNIQRHDFETTIDTQLNPRRFILMMDDSQDTKDILDTIQLAHPPKVHLQARGNWDSISNIQASGSFEATNFVALGQPIGLLSFGISYTNPLVNITNLQIVQGDQVVHIPEAHYNFNDDRVSLVNAASTFNPRRIFNALAPVIPPFLVAIWFDDPTPSVRAYGFFSLSNDRDVDLHFQIAGKKFRWSDYTADTASGNVDWIGPDVWLTNVVTSLYGGGQMTGWATFDCRVKGVAIRFAASAQDVDLKGLAHDISGRNMDLEGKLNVSVDVHGRADSRKSWEGTGDASLRDGLLWDIPMFGRIISPVLNGISKGAANNVAREASGSFIVTNGVVYSDRVEIQASFARLIYSGTVDEKTIDAKVEAQPLRNTPVIGQAISFLFTPLTKVMKYRVTGPVGDPQISPEYVPVMLLDKTLHPIKTIKDTFIPSSSNTSNSGSDTQK